MSIYLIPEGITFSPTWVPTYSFALFIVLYIYFTVFMTILTLNPLRHIDPLGFIMIIGAIYGAIYFITTDNQLFKSIYGVFALIFEVTAALLIYYGLGRKL